MMSESLESRKFERKALFDVPLPMRRAQREVAPSGDDSGNEGSRTPPDAQTTAFSLMTKKGNRQQVGWKWVGCNMAWLTLVADTHY